MSGKEERKPHLGGGGGGGMDGWMRCLVYPCRVNPGTGTPSLSLRYISLNVVTIQPPPSKQTNPLSL